LIEIKFLTFKFLFAVKKFFKKMNNKFLKRTSCFKRCYNIIQYNFESEITERYKKLKAWGKTTNTNCFRLYNNENINYPIILEYYNKNISAQYISKSKKDIAIDESLQREINTSLERVIKNVKIIWKIRRKSKQSRQNEKLNNSKIFFIVKEYGMKFLINITDYIDNGLFLDHRETRNMISKVSKDKTILNLFSYTCSFSISASLGGSRLTKSVGNFI
jgi:23S rRNA (cytosine1962-C5)-methyltransferase